MKNLTGLDKLRQTLLNKDSEKYQVYNLCAAMELVGGYSELMNLPIPALRLVIEYLEQTKKSMPKLKR